MDFSVFFANKLVLDKSVWRLWLMGLTVEQTTNYLTAKRVSLASNTIGLRNFVTSQVTSAPSRRIGQPKWLMCRATVHAKKYRNYELLEPYLHRPKTFLMLPLFPMPRETQQYLIETYYSFEEVVLREILGKKFSSRVRKDLEDVCMKTKVPLAGCRRMFDNFKRVVRVIEDTDKGMMAVLQKEFLLPKPLASEYAHIIFINNYRLDTFKRKLAHIKLSDYEYVASIFISHFTSPVAPILDELDASLAQDARDMKTIVFNQKGVLDEYRTLVTANLAKTGQQQIVEKGGQNGFKLILRNIFAIGAGLAHSKELRDVFLSLQEKVVEPFIMFGLSSQEMDFFLSAVKTEFASVQSMNPQTRKRYSKSCARLFDGIKLSALRFYEAASNI